MIAPSRITADRLAPSRTSDQRSWTRSLRPLYRNHVVLAGLVLVTIAVLAALFADLISPSDPLEMDVMAAFQGPSLDHWFGTDAFGRDILSRAIHGSRISLWVGLSSVAGATLFGTALGLVAGYFGGWAELLVSRFIDILFSFPSLLLAVAIAAMLGPGINNAIIAIIVVYTPLFARVVRASMLAERGKEYVEAARVAGGGNTRIVMRHILPNLLSPLIVQASMTVASAILLESYLSFLGLGTQPPDPSWGTMLNEGKMMLEIAPWVSIFPGLCIIGAVLGFSLLGDGLRDVLDPRSR